MEDRLQMQQQLTTLLCMKEGQGEERGRETDSQKEEDKNHILLFLEALVGVPQIRLRPDRNLPKNHLPYLISFKLFP